MNATIHSAAEMARLEKAAAEFLEVCFDTCDAGSSPDAGWSTAVSIAVQSVQFGLTKVDDTPEVAERFWIGVGAGVGAALANLALPEQRAQAMALLNAGIGEGVRQADYALTPRGNA